MDMENTIQNSSPAEAQKPNPYLVPFAIVVAGIMIAGAVMYSQTPRGGGGATGVPVEQKVNVKDVDTNGEPFIGKTDAPLTLVYWLDFQCPFCQRFDLQTLPVLIEKYVNTGKLKVVFKDYQFLSEDSHTGGLAAHAVWELYPAKYFEWHTAMFEAQDEEHGGFGDKASIIALTRKVSGIDENAISRLMEQKKAEYQAEQDADKAEGAKFGVQGTPGFILGTQRVSGAQPIEVFSQLVDEELAKLKK